MKTSINHIRMITGTGAVLEDAALAYENGIITGIGEGSIEADEMIDGTGRTMIPGLFDCHVHLGMEVPGAVVPQQETDRTLLGARIMKQCLEFPRYGITAVRNMATLMDSDIVIKNFLEEQGFPSIRILASGDGISITGGHGNPENGCDSADEVLRVARERIKERADVIKFVMTGGMGTRHSKPGSLQYHAEDIADAVREAEICGKITGAHCTSLEGAWEAIRAGVRSIEHAQLDEETADLMAERARTGREIFYCPTITARYSILNNHDPAFAWLTKKAKPGDLERKKKAIRLCMEREIPIVAGTDTNSPFVPVGGLLKELELYVESGMTEMQAIRTATANAAKLCMLERVTGTLEEGKHADYVILSANPLEDIRNLAQVERTCRDGHVLYQREHWQGKGIM